MTLKTTTSALTSSEIIYHFGKKGMHIFYCFLQQPEKFKKEIIVFPRNVFLDGGLLLRKICP